MKELKIKIQKVIEFDEEDLKEISLIFELARIELDRRITDKIVQYEGISTEYLRVIYSKFSERI